MVQNWIGRQGATMEQATYILPDSNYLMEYLSNFEKYILFDEKDRLIQLSIVHAQFEIIHPFVDGNSRLGRILIPLFLFEKIILNSPMFYISEYLKACRDEYYAKLNYITKERKWDEWVEFFPKAIIEQAKVNCRKAKEILELYNRKKERITEITHSHYGIKVLDTLFAWPIFSITRFISRSKIPKASAMRLFSVLKKEKITFKPGSGRI